MDLLNEFGKRFSNVARSVSERARENPELTRLNGELKAAQARLEKLYTRYGKACFAIRQSGNDGGEAEKLALRLQAVCMEVEELSARRDEAREMRRCGNCGTVHPAQARFCSNCGKRLQEDSPKPEPAPEGIYCPSCGAERAGSDVRCPVCGADFMDEPGEEFPLSMEASAWEGPDVEEPTENETRQWD